MKKFLTILFILFAGMNVLAATRAELTSPDGRLKFLFEQNGTLSYSVIRDGKVLIAQSQMGVAMKG